MSDLALRVEGLSKRYRIGKSRNLFERLNVRTFQRSNAPSSERSNVSTFQRSNADILWALKNFSFDVRKGEVMGTLAPARSAGVIGPFGGAGNPRKGARAGSTLLKILSGITEPTSAAPFSTAAWVPCWTFRGTPALVPNPEEVGNYEHKCERSD